MSHQALVRSTGAIPDGYVATYSATDGYWEAKPAATGSFSAGGDLSGSSSNQTVIKINGASVPVSGSLTTGNVLQVNGSSSLTYGAVNLAGGANYVTGTLPTGNQAAQSLSGDVTGTTASNTVISLTGSGGFVDIASTGAALNWSTGTSAPTLKQANNTTNSATGQALTIQAQNATGTSSTGGALVLKSGTGTSTDGVIDFDIGASTKAFLNTDKLVTSVGRRIQTTVTTTNLTIVDGYEVIIVGTLSGTVTITLPASPTAGDIYTIKDQGGDAASFNIIVDGNGNNIDGLSTYTINTDYQSITVIFANGTWSVL